MSPKFFFLIVLITFQSLNSPPGILTETFLNEFSEFTFFVNKYSCFTMGPNS
eukprot:TRINITY_DN637_c0_g1_i1.p2 TRINITY_DN637_c0_g1~~TRINITY_DN637_c0_g1_i1.p2  ORF type:complete len:52 (+),score=7.50 TRINITY_DN637_c0_g1_i1:10-165(+)